MRAASSALKVMCECGMDCADFIHQHAIPVNALFACPGCDAQLSAQVVEKCFAPGEVTEALAANAP